MSLIERLREHADEMYGYLETNELLLEAARVLDMLAKELELAEQNLKAIGEKFEQETASLLAEIDRLTRELRIEKDMGRPWKQEIEAHQERVRIAEASLVTLTAQLEEARAALDQVLANNDALSKHLLTANSQLEEERKIRVLEREGLQARVKFTEDYESVARQRDELLAKVEDYKQMHYRSVKRAEIAEEQLKELKSGSCPCQCHRNGGPLTCVHGKCCDGGPK